MLLRYSYTMTLVAGQGEMAMERNGAGRPIPYPDTRASLASARALRRGGILAALEALHASLGDIFFLPLPGFRGVILAGPEANRLALIEERDRLLWRAEGDPVTLLLRQGVLVTDGALHDQLRQAMTPAMHRGLFEGFAQVAWRSVDRVTRAWRDGVRVDPLEESRRIALLALMEALYGEDFAPWMSTLWNDITRTVRYISPGPWLIWPSVPRLGYTGALRRMDGYFREVIARRRAGRAGSQSSTDLPGLLIAAGLSDDLIRDQLFTMFIAGHDTSASLLAWSLSLLAWNPEIQARARAEVDATLGGGEPAAVHTRQLPYLDRVIKETLRLYPPIHLGSRIAAADITFHDYVIPAGARVLYSIYLAHRDPRVWPEPARFDPDRFTPEGAAGRPALSYAPFGGGPRNCIGATFAQLEAKITLARLLQRYTLTPAGPPASPRMRATLEPYPGAYIAPHERPAQPL